SLDARSMVLAPVRFSLVFFFSSRRRHTRFSRDWSSDVCSSDLLAMNDEIVPELAWQMGRPVRYGGEKGGVEERTRFMVEIAEKALAPHWASNPKPGFRRYVKKEPAGVVMVIAPWNYPYLTAVNTVVPAI